MLVGGRCRRKTKYAVRIGCRLDGPVDHDALIEQFDVDRLRDGHPRNLSKSFRGHSRTLAQGTPRLPSSLLRVAGLEEARDSACRTGDDEHVPDIEENVDDSHSHAE